MRSLLVWLGDQFWVPEPLGSWLLRMFSPVDPEPWVDAEGRLR